MFVDSMYVNDDVNLEGVVISSLKKSERYMVECGED